jgi:alpha-tubulin suppressor-like RCC1 family protein
VAGYDLVTGLGSPTCAAIAQLASPTPTVPLPPNQSPPSSSPSFAGIGLHDTCAMNQNVVESWGLDQTGANGTGTFDNVNTDQHLSPVGPQVSAQGTRVSSVASGSGHAFAIFQSDGSVWCWGDNEAGQLGVTAVDVNNQPLVKGTAHVIEGLPNDTPVQIAAGCGTTCVVYAGGSVWCWGQNDFGQLGNGTVIGPNSTPTQVQDLPPASQVSISSLGTTTCAVLQNGGVSCWGGGPLGNGSS